MCLPRRSAVHDTKNASHLLPSVRPVLACSRVHVQDTKSRILGAKGMSVDLC